MKLLFLKQKALDDLEKNFPDNKSLYESGSRWIDEYFSKKGMPNYSFDTGIEINDFQLTIGGPEKDFENAKIIYETFGNILNPVQASDLRLWAYLSHDYCWDYMHHRWKIELPDEEDADEESGKTAEEKVIGRIGTRYFFKASKGKAFVRQGIARLYWSAYLTYESDNLDNPYELTEYLLSDQDIFSSLTERSYARNKIIVLAALKEMKQYNISRKKRRLFLSKLNQAGAITVLDFLDETQASQLCHRLMLEVL